LTQHSIEKQDKNYKKRKRYIKYVTKKMYNKNKIERDTKEKQSEMQDILTTMT